VVDGTARSHEPVYLFRAPPTRVHPNNGLPSRASRLCPGHGSYSSDIADDIRQVLRHRHLGRSHIGQPDGPPSPLDGDKAVFIGLAVEAHFRLAANVSSL
jgi:hypothetical protein